MSDERTPDSTTIPQLNALVRRLVEAETSRYLVVVSGVTSHLYTSDLGHTYFDISDEGFTISCILTEKTRARYANLELSGGIEVEVIGTIRVYEQQAKVQIGVEQIRVIDSAGSTPDFDVLERLKAAGLYPKPARTIPATLKMIGIVTSKNSDALRDFEDAYRNEGGLARWKINDVPLESESAPRQIAAAIARFNRDKDVDVIVLTRGGGRGAVLAVFNDYLIAEAICKSQIPVVTGIGHQRNETTADRVADHAAITPTAAALHLAKLSRHLEDTAFKPKTGVPVWVYLFGIVIIAAAVVIAALILGQ